MAATAVAWQRLKLDDALPNVGVYSLVQDADGYIWFGSTNVGIVRYDGIHFRTFDLSQINPIGEVPDIDKLLFNREGQLWAGSWGYGLIRLDLQQNTTLSFSAGPKPNELYSPFIQAMLEDKQGQIWIGTNRGLNRFDAEHGLTKWADQQQAILGKPLVNARVWGLAETADGRVWIATSQGLQFYQEQTGLSDVIEPHGHGVADNEIRALLADGSLLWIGTRAGLFLLDTTNMQLTQMPYYQGFNYPIINALTKDSYGDLVIGSFDGISVLENQTKQLRPLEQGDNALKGINVRSLLVDRTGLLWAGTRERAIYKGRLFKHEFNAWPLHEDYSELLKTQSPVLSFHKDSQGLWLGRANHIDWQLNGSPTPHRFQTNARVNTFGRDLQGTLWVGTDIGLLKQSDPEHFVVDNHWLQLISSGPQNVRDLLFTDDGTVVLNLWGNGVLLVKGEQHQHLLADISQKITGNAVQDIVQIDQSLYLGTRLSGLYRYDLVTQQLTWLNEQQPTLSKKISCLAKGPAQSLLLCSANGLQQIKLATMQLTTFDESTHLPSKELLGAYTDEQQRIWLLSSQGLSVLASASNRFINYSEVDGLSSREMMFKAISGEHGAIFVGSANGFDRIATEQIWQNDVPPSVVLTQLWLDDEPVKAAWQTHCCKAIELNPGQSSFKLQFAALDFNDSSLNQLEVKLQGYDKRWLRLGPDAMKYYVNVPPGNYDLLFRATNNHGVPSTQRSLPVIILPVWYQRPIVQFSMVLLLAGIAGSLIRYRMESLKKINQLLQESVHAKAVNEQQLEQKVNQRTSQLSAALSDLAKSNEQLRELDGLKDDFISTVSHELRTPLTSIHGAIRLINSGQLDQQPEVIAQLRQTAEENSNRLLVLVNDLLDLQKFESGAMELHKTEVNLNELLQQTLEGIASYAEKFQVRLQAPSEMPPLRLTADSFRLRQVLENLVANAIKFSVPGGLVRVELIASEPWLEVAIIDQGEGIAADVQKRLFTKFVQADSSSNKTRYGSGLGLAICKRIIELHGGAIGFESELGQGSRFWFRLPRITNVESAP